MPRARGASRFFREGGMPRKYHNETKAMLIARLEAYEASQGVDLGRMDEGLSALDAVVRDVSTTNVANTAVLE